MSAQNSAGHTVSFQMMGVIIGPGVYTIDGVQLCVFMEQEILQSLL